MPRSIQIAVPADLADSILLRVDKIDGVTGVVRHPNASVNPPGDVLTIQSTNDAIREVFSELEKLGVHKRGAIFSNDLKCLISPGHEDQLESEGNETIWDEMASLLRQDTNLDFNYLALMFLAGAVAAGGLWADKIHLVIGAMVIAPAFEPLLRIPFGLVCGVPALTKRGLLSVLFGYLMLILGAAVCVLILRLLDAGSVSQLESQAWVSYWSSFSIPGVLVSVFGAAAGAIVVSGLRSVLTTGVMITLALVPSMSLVGMGIVIADLSLAAQGFARWAVDAALVIVMSAIVLALKKKLIHKRNAMG